MSTQKRGLGLLASAYDEMSCCKFRLEMASLRKQPSFCLCVIVT